MASPVGESDEEWLAAQVAQHRPVDGRARTGGDRLSISSAALRDLILTARRPFGLRVSGLKVLGILDLSYADIKGPIGIIDSEFDGRISCVSAMFVSLDLTDSSLPSLDCDGARCQHDMMLLRMSAEYAVFHDAKIGGTLVMSGATLTRRNNVAARADRLRVEGGVICGNGFSAIGQVRLHGAHIGGQLDLSGGRFSNPGGYALSLDEARIAGGVFCRNGFSATGDVRLIGAVIGGQLSLTGGEFNNPGGYALSLDEARVSHGVFCGGVRVTGEVRLLGANIDGPLELTGGRFSNPGGDALSCDRARIAGNLFCGEGFSASGVVRMHGAEVRGQLDLTGGQFNNPDGDALVAEHANIDTFLFTKANDGSSGRINLTGARIRYLQDNPAAWQSFQKIALLDLTYDRISYRGWATKQRLSWLRKGGTHENQPYEQLASTLRAQGHERDARKVLIAKHRQQRRQQPRWAQLPGLIFDVLLAYGYRPLQRTLPLLIALYALGAFLLYQARDHGAVIATRAPVHVATAASTPATNGQPQPIVATKHCPPDYSCFSPLAYTADVLIPLVNTGQTDYWTIVSKHGDSGAIWYIRLAPALGWILSTAAALGFTGLILRD